MPASTTTGPPVRRAHRGESPRALAPGWRPMALCAPRGPVPVPIPAPRAVSRPRSRAQPMAQSAPSPSQPPTDPAKPGRLPALALRPLVAVTLTPDEFRILRNTLGLGADQLAQMLEEFGDADIEAWARSSGDARAQTLAAKRGWDGDLTAQRVKGWERGRVGPSERASSLVLLLDDLVTALAAEVLAHARYQGGSLLDLPPRDGRTATAMLDSAAREGAMAPHQAVTARLLVNAPPEAIQALCAAAWSRAWLFARMVPGHGLTITSGRL